MNILLSNDDGIESEGIFALAEMLKRKNNVLIIAPDGNRSACGHSITIGNKLKLQEMKIIDGIKAYAFAGTPSDCIKFAMTTMNFKPDAVISGINKGSNLGTDVMYSGTVSAALEGAVYGCNSIAVSSTGYENNDFKMCADILESLLPDLLDKADDTFIWNINIPCVSRDKIKGIKYTRLGIQIYSDRYDTEGDGHYILSGEPQNHSNNVRDCDVEWNKKNYITDVKMLRNIKKCQK